MNPLISGCLIIIFNNAPSCTELSINVGKSKVFIGVKWTIDRLTPYICTHETYFAVA